jgi:N6-adenosine-specific RNA methylase IME4
MNDMRPDPVAEFREMLAGRTFSTVLADPPWRFENRTGKMAPEHRRLSRYGTMELEEIMALPVAEVTGSTAHLYLWVPNALLPEGLRVLEAWGFRYKSNIIWHKVRRDGGSDGRGVGFYFRNVTEMVLFGVKGPNARTLAAGRRQVNYLATQKREHSRKPDEFYDIVESCSPGPYLELFARGTRDGWMGWGNQSDAYEITWNTYAHNSQTAKSDSPRAESITSPESGNRQLVLHVGEKRAPEWAGTEVHREEAAGSNGMGNQNGLAQPAAMNENPVRVRQPA